MEKIALPKKIEFIKGEKPNQGIISVEPCYPGYGMTLGNALRRVMLSSLPGAAVVGVKIKGVTHEFTALPHVQEDVLEIILNLKQLRLRVNAAEEDEEIKLELKVHGTKEVKAGDITKNSQVEIFNPDLVIANITDMSGSLDVEIFVKQGIGYQTVESVSDKKGEVGYIQTDSAFSPVFSVGINIENVRVGKMTNWDKLNLNVITDGTITPEEAFKNSVNILIEQFQALLNGGVDDEKDEEVVEEVEKEEKKEKKSKKDKDQEEDK